MKKQFLALLIILSTSAMTSLLAAETFLNTFSPKDHTITDSPSFTAHGSIDGPITALDINGKNIELRDDRSFSAQIYAPLPGKYQLTLTGRTKDGNTLTEQRNFIRRAVLSDLSEDTTADRTIIALATAGAFPSGNDRQFRPGASVSKEEVAVWIARIKGLSFSSDLDALKKVSLEGVFPPKDASAAPVKWLTRADAVYIAVKLDEQMLDRTAGTPFIDIPLDHWCASYIDIAYKRDWLTDLVPSGSHTFKPLSAVTRRDMAILLGRTKPFQQALSRLTDWSNTKDLRNAQVTPLGIKKTLSMDLSNVALPSVLNTFSRESGLNVVYGKNVQGSVSAHFKDVEPMTALNAILESTGYTYAIEGANLLRIVPLKGTTGGADTQIRTFTISYANIDTLTTELIKLVPSLQGKVLVGRSSNSLIISSNHPEIKKIEEIIKRLDAPPLQVMVQAQIFETSLEDGNTVGTSIEVNNTEGSDTSYAKTAGFATEPPATNPSGLYVKIVNGDMTAYFNAVRSRSDFDLLSSPRIMALNNQEASMSTGEDVGYQDTTITYTSAGSVTSKTTKFLQATTELKFTPHINQDGYIMIDLRPIISEVSLDSATSVPSLKKTEAHTQVIVADGQTFIIGGLVKDKIQETVQEVPVLSSIPLLGELFKKKVMTKTKRNITVMVTPRIVDAFHTEDMNSEINSVQNEHKAPQLNRSK